MQDSDDLVFEVSRDGSHGYSLVSNRKEQRISVSFNIPKPSAAKTATMRPKTPAIFMMNDRREVVVWRIECSE